MRRLDIQPVVLEGKVIRLEPAEERHAAGLVNWADPETFRYFLSIIPREQSEEGLKEYIRTCRAQSNLLTYTMILQETGEPIGSSSYLDIRPDHLMVEVGMTWIGRDYRGTKVNPEAKLLMIGHAIEVLGCERVQLKTDGRNKQSQAAITKLGAKYEGTLRSYGQMMDGFMRDTVMYSILPPEWPAVKAGLEARLADS